jgi:hypothetical protein
MVICGQFMAVMGAVGRGRESSAGEPPEGPGGQHRLGEIPGDGRQRPSRHTGR